MSFVWLRAQKSTFANCENPTRVSKNRRRNREKGRVTELSRAWLCLWIALARPRNRDKVCLGRIRNRWTVEVLNEPEITESSPDPRKGQKAIRLVFLLPTELVNNPSSESTPLVTRPHAEWGKLGNLDTYFGYYSFSFQSPWCLDFRSMQEVWRIKNALLLQV